MSSPIALDLERFLWHRPLVTACLRNFSTVASLFAGDPSDPRAWREAVQRVQGAERDHAALSRILTDQLMKRGAPAQALDAAASLADARTVAVVTGQQAGLFGGPLYTILKAVTAIQLARRLELEAGVRAVPVFWVEDEDHDWQEVRVAHVLDADHQLRDITASDPPGAGQLSVGRLTFDDHVNVTVAELFEALPATAFTGELRTVLERRYAPGMGAARAFASWMDDLLGQHGMVVFEAHDPSAKPLVADLFAAELEHAGRTSRLAGEAARAMAALGHAPQIEPPDKGVALFYLTATARVPIKRQGANFQIGDAIHTPQAVRDEARQHPERFSPNVLLRPLVQDRLFPTVCYVAGPSELAYQAQLGGVYKAFGVPAPLIMPRVSATLVDSAAVRFLDRHALSLEDLHQEEETALTRLIERALPTDVEASLAAMQGALAERGAALKAAIVGLDQTLTGAVDTTIDRMRDTLQSLHGKIIQATKRNDETLRRQFKRTYALVSPGAKPQERVLSVAFFVNRYGSDLIAKLIETLPLQTDQHYVVTI